jgi:hypothetical protein
MHASALSCRNNPAQRLAIPGDFDDVTSTRLRRKKVNGRVDKTAE